MDGSTGLAVAQIGDPLRNCRTAGVARGLAPTRSSFRLPPLRGGDRQPNSWGGKALQHTTYGCGEQSPQNPSPDLDPGARPPRLHSHDVEWIAARVADLLANGEAEAGPARFGDAPAVAEKLGVKPSWVYAHARELGGVRLGETRGRFRFDLKKLEQALKCRDEQAIQRDHRGPVMLRKSPCGQKSLATTRMTAGPLALGNRATDSTQTYLQG